MDTITPLIGKPDHIFMILRPFLAADAELLFHWKNDPVTRANSGNTSVVPWEGHAKWFYGALSDPNGKVLRIASVDGVPVGLVRTAKHGDGRTEIHYTVSPVFRSMGLGKAMVAKFVSELTRQGVISGVGDLVLPIKQGNIGSEKIAAALGLVAHMSTATIIEEGQPALVDWAVPEAQDA